MVALYFSSHVLDFFKKQVIFVIACKNVTNIIKI
jgi:hypothetical protein